MTSGSGSSKALPSVYIGSAITELATEPEAASGLAALAQQIMADPVALQTLSDRVFQLLAEDLRLQRDRSRHYGSR